MAFTEGGSEGSLNGTTPVTLVASPAAATRRLIRNVKIHNSDTAVVTLYIGRKKASTTYRLATRVLDPGDTTVIMDEILDATDESLVAEMTGAAATTNPTFTTMYADSTT